jgi:polysaccharide pyruvyl transferase WcaK-like protein
MYARGVSGPRRTLSIGWFGEGNLGDEAMLEGLLAVLRRALGEIDATVMSGNPARTAAVHGVRTIPRQAPERSGFRNVTLLREVARADLVTLGGGDLIREQADGVVPALNWLARIRTALALRRPVALIGVSVGDLEAPRVRRAVSDYLRRIPLIAARDSASAAALTELGAEDVWTIGDLALESWTPDVVRPQRSAGPVRIGVATREILGRGRSVPADADEHLRRELAIALDELVTTLDARVELIPCRTRGPQPRPDDDARAGEALAAVARTGATWTRHQSPSSAAEFGAIARELDLVIAVRLHGAVLSAAAGRPLLGISYDRKVSGFLEDLGLSSQCLRLDCTADEVVDAARRTLADTTMVRRVQDGVASLRAQTAAFAPRLAALAGRGGR